MHDAGTTMAATSIAMMSRTNAPQAMALAEKPKKFMGIEFKRWQQEMFFYLTTLCLQRFTVEKASGVPEKTSEQERFVIVEAWKQSDFLCLIVKHKCKEVSVEDLIVRLYIEEDNKAAERRSRDCRAPKKGKKKDQENLAESKKEMDDLCAMLSECNLVGNPREWWMNSDATLHVCANKELFPAFAPAQVEEKIYMTNSATAKVEGVGKVCSKMTYGKVLTLNNVLYVLELRKSLISVSLLDKNGFKCVFIFRKVVLSKGEVYVGKGYLNEGLLKMNVTNIEINKILISSYLVESYNL
ncbi:hypothetical protein CQW23_03180 [Capsicum baccatum]|uniref:Retrovirus-related Pol polyprotein from transposon TNT 1-94-like beta-barrel domain-containing protein n=1 Tax=Capsicum baccatum TaxID=33114 RepID=A0A2G2XB11_CAPBA|nr:hypothetical protein CQW23_03180 [Capsicum baccatum]